MRALPLVLLNRVVSDPLEAVLSRGGALHALVERSVGAKGLFDLQLRADPKNGRNWASFYVGLTSVLDIYEVSGRFIFEVHATHETKSHQLQRDGALGAFQASWKSPMTAENLATQLAAVEAYLDLMCSDGGVADSFTNSEGRVQGALCTGPGAGGIAFQREGVLSFRTTPIRLALTAPFRARTLAAIAHGMPVPAPLGGPACAMAEGHRIWDWRSTCWASMEPEGFS